MTTDNKDNRVIISLPTTANNSDAEEQTTAPDKPTDETLEEKIHQPPKKHAPPSSNKSMPKKGATTAKYDEYITAFFPSIGENLDLGKQYPVTGVGRKLGELFGFERAFKTTTNDIIKEAIHHADLLDENGDELYTKISDIPNEAIKEVRDEVANLIQNDHYQSVVSFTSSTDQYLIELIAKGEIGLDFYSMRSSDPKIKVKPIDVLINAENLFFGIELTSNLYQLGKTYDENTGVLATLNKLRTNPYVDLELRYLAGVCFGLPLAADIIESGHPVEYIQEHYVKKIEELFHFKSHPEQDKKSDIIEAGKIIIGSYAGETTKVAAKAKEIIDNPDHPILHSLSKLVKDEASIVAKTGALTIRLMHSAFISQPYMTEFSARMAIYVAAENAIKKLYGDE